MDVACGSSTLMLWSWELFFGDDGARFRNAYYIRCDSSIIITKTVIEMEEERHMKRKFGKLHTPQHVSRLRKVWYIDGYHKKLLQLARNAWIFITNFWMYFDFVFPRFELNKILFFALWVKYDCMISSLFNACKILVSHPNCSKKICLGLDVRIKDIINTQSYLSNKGMKRKYLIWTEQNKIKQS